MFYSLYVLLFLAGLAGGFLAGLLGIGGGIIFITVIPYALESMGVPSSEMAPYIIANSIFATFFSSLSGSYVLMRKRSFYLKEVLTIGFFASLSSLAWLYFFVNTPHYSRQFFSFFVIIILLIIFIKTLVARRVAKIDKSPRYRYIQYTLVGLIGGTVSALTGLGGGVIVVSMLAGFMHFPILKSTSISQGVIGLNAIAVTVFNLYETPSRLYHTQQVGYIIVPIVVVLSVGVLMTSGWGVRIARQLRPGLLTYLFAGFILVLLIKKIIDLYGEVNL